jgi:hypothetical protein
VIADPERIRASRNDTQVIRPHRCRRRKPRVENLIHHADPETAHLEASKPIRRTMVRVQLAYVISPTSSRSTIGLLYTEAAQSANSSATPRALIQRRVM